MTFQERPVRLYILMESNGPVWPAMEFTEESARQRAEQYARETGKCVQLIEVTETKRLELRGGEEWCHLG